MLLKPAVLTNALYNANADIEWKFLKRFDSIAPNWRKSTGDVAGLETGRLYQTLKRMYEEWKALEDFEVLDRNFQALLALAVATSWFTKEQLDDLDTWPPVCGTIRHAHSDAEKPMGGVRNKRITLALASHRRHYDKCCLRGV
ncbi:hypothetical protein AK812_SmicGene32855 [Symbiodinium microadriaticum]|uniref:Uncharacterized protein n=1 Tax=Symbiodinium microadriaticum TaxID=2951 RepID=A0A1Q9CT25_SYMMI|nr:hypothetical protein AK812_SmicGene32855 [Symbiodinium microadriaticum]